jgi:hypothetical protein
LVWAVLEENMEQSNNKSTTICPFCKSENPDISVCLTCGAKIKREQLNAKDLIPRPVWLSVLAGFYALGFMKKAFYILYQNNGVAIIVLIILAIVDFSIAYGLWQLKKWAWIVVVISCCVGIIFVWINPILLWLNPSEGLKLVYKSFFHVISSAPFLRERAMSMAIKGALIRAIVGTIINGLILKYFYSNLIRGIFSDNPIKWRAAKY